MWAHFQKFLVFLNVLADPKPIYFTQMIPSMCKPWNKLSLRHPLPTFGSFSFFQASILLGVDKILQKLTKSYKVSWDIYFNAASWFPWNVRVKPHSKHSKEAAASVAWPHGRRPQAEAIESSGQGEEEWGEKEGRRKEKQTVAVLCLLSRGWPCYYYSTTLG